MSLDRKRLTIQLKHLRTKRGWSQAALSKRAGLAMQYVARLEQGKHDPSLSTLSKLAKALKCTVGELVK
jgi:transcriptional regulator with XRE-family HTH domain